MFNLIVSAKNNPISTIVITILFLLPFIIRPTIFSGDEPHYLIAINSIIKDGDLNLTNNYFQALKGDNEAGISFAGRLIDHQTVFIKKGYQPLFWPYIYNLQTLTIHPEYSNIDLKAYKELPRHSIIYISIIATPIYFLFSNWLSTEIAVLILNTILTIGIAILFFQLSSQFLNSTNAKISTLALLFATPLWFYSKTAYPDILLTFLLVASTLLFLKQKNLALSAILLALGAGIKISFGIVPIVFGFHFLLTKKYHQIVIFSFSFILIFSIYLLINYLIYNDPLFFPPFGNPLKSNEATSINTIFPALKDLLLSPRLGLFIFLPVSLFSILGIGKIAKNKRVKFYPLIFLVLSIIAVLSTNKLWFVGYTYGPRYLLPIIPFIILFAFYWYQEEKRSDLKLLFIISLLISFTIQLYSVLLPPVFILSQPPFMI